jgi:drug/metabolite transporter (DMT)-like permease
MEMLAGSAALYTLALLTGEFTAFHPGAVTLRSWIAVGYLASFGSIIGFSAYVWLLRIAHASRVATYAYVNPVIALVLGWALAGEAFTPHTIVAAAVIILGVVLIITSQSREQAAAKSPPPQSRPRKLSSLTSPTAEGVTDDAG